MKTTKKALLALVCAVALVFGSVFATYAYLTSTTDTVTNTFTVGKVEITLDEAPVDVDGKKTTGDRVIANTYKLIPGKTYDKDPTVHVQPGSEKCYVFVEVVNGIQAFVVDTIENQIVTTNVWTKLEDGVYYKTVEAVAEDEAAVDLPVFANFKVSDNANNVNGWKNIGKGNEIVVKAYAIQYAGFEGNVAGAWDTVSDAENA